MFEGFNSTQKRRSNNALLKRLGCELVIEKRGIGLFGGGGFVQGFKAWDWISFLV